MDFNLNEDQLMFQESAREFAEKRLFPIAEEMDAKGEMPEDLIKVYTQFGIDVAKHNGDDSWTLPLPVRLIIDPDGIIRDAEISADYTVRPEPEDTLEKLKKLMDQIH